MELFLKYKYLLLVVVLSFISIISLFHYGLIPTHDGEYHIIRFYEFDKVLRDGVLYPRWAFGLNKGYGIPLFNFVYPLPNYIASLIHLFGFSFIDSFKISLIAASFLSGLLVFLWLRSFFSKISALAGATFFIYTPYRFVDIYVRGSVGELWAMAFFPGFLWSISRLIIEKKYTYAIPASLFLAATVLSHNIVGLMFFIFGLLYSLALSVYVKDVKSVTYVGMVMFLSLGLSAIFWLPALLEKEFVKGLEVYEIKNNFVELYSLIFPSWGTGFSEGNLNNKMSFQIGIANLVVVFLSFFLLFKKSLYKMLVIFILTCFMLAVYLMLPYSKKVWESVPLLNFFQFPWRFLSLLVICVSFLAGYVSSIVNNKMCSVILIIATIVFSIGYTKPAYYLERSDSYYLTRANFTDGTNSPGNVFNTIWFDTALKKKKEKIEIISGNGIINSQKITTNKYIFAMNVLKESKIVINTAFYPGWTVSIDGLITHIFPSSGGVITFYVPAGTHVIEVGFRDTLIRSIAKSISIISLMFIILLFLKNYYVRIRR